MPKTIVSNAGIYNTYNHLLPTKIAQEKGLAANLKRLKPSVGHVCLYIGLRHSKSSLNLGKANYWIFPDNYSHNKNIADYLANPDSDIPVAYVSFPAAKDPDWEKEFPERSTIEIITLAPYKWWEKWQDEEWMKRGDEYESEKEKLSLRLMEKLFEQEASIAR